MSVTDTVFVSSNRFFIFGMILAAKRHKDLPSAIDYCTAMVGSHGSRSLCASLLGSIGSGSLSECQTLMDKL